MLLSQILRREVSPSAIQLGQIVQVRMKFRLLRQENGNFTFREVLKGVSILHDGLSMVRLKMLASMTHPHFRNRPWPVSLQPNPWDPSTSTAATSNFMWFAKKLCRRLSTLRRTQWLNSSVAVHHVAKQGLESGLPRILIANQLCIPFVLFKAE